MKSLMKIFYIIFSVLIFLSSSTLPLFAQSTFSKNLGTDAVQKALSVVQTRDGGFAIAGYTDGFNPLNYGDYDGYLVKLDCNGSMMWSKIYGDTSSASTTYGDESMSCVIETPDGGLMLAGRTNSYGAQDNDLFIVKTDPAGNSIWSKIYGTVQAENVFKITQTRDSNYVVLGGYVAGICSSFVTNFYIELIKINEQGDTLWARQYGPLCGGGVESVAATSDWGVIVAGDNYLLKISCDGNVQ